MFITIQFEALSHVLRLLEWFFEKEFIHLLLLCRNRLFIKAVFELLIFIRVRPNFENRQDFIIFLLETKTRVRAERRTSEIQ